MKMAKKVKPKYIVDLTKVESCEDIKLQFIKAKSLAGVKITEDEFKFIIKYGTELAFDTIDLYLAEYTKYMNTVTIQNDKLVKDMIELIEKAIKPKKPWYKRFWGWLTRKKD